MAWRVSIDMEYIFCLAVVFWCVTLSLAQWDCISLVNRGEYNGSATTYCDNYECDFPCSEPVYGDPTEDSLCSVLEDSVFPTCFSEYGDIETCDVPACNMHAGCYNPSTNGSDYRGLGRYTETGYQCLYWSGVMFDNWNVSAHPDAGLEDDYCRNPTNLERPWCFHVNSDGELQWSYCHIPACTSTLLSEFTRITNSYNSMVPNAPGNRWESTRFDEYILDMEEECARLCVEEPEFVCRQYHVSFPTRYCEWLEYGEYHQSIRVAYRYDTKGDVFIRKSTFCEGFDRGIIQHHCALPLGMESSWIADADIRASTYLDEDHAPHFARLYGNSAWIPHPYDRDPVIQVTFPERMIVTGLLIQGGGEADDLFVSLFRIAFRVEGYNRVMFYQQSIDDYAAQIFEGNTESSCVVQVFFPRPIWTHEIQVWPYVRDGPVALRLEFFGCRDNECDSSLLQGILNPFPDNVDASSIQDPAHHAGLVTLNPFQRGRTGWIPGSVSIDRNPWLQVFFGFGRNIAGLMSRKCGDGSGGQGWLALFDLTWALPGFSSLDAGQNETLHDLFLNYTGGGSLARIYFETMLYDTQIVRISPTDWGGDYRCLTLELMGCDYSVYSHMLDDKDHEKLIAGVSCLRCNTDTLSEWRLHKYASDGSSGIEFTSGREKWIEIEFNGPFIVSGFITQGGTGKNVTFVGALDNLIDDYMISYQSVGDAALDDPWRKYVDTDGNTMVFSGLQDPFGVTTNNFDRPFMAVRLRVTLQHNEDLNMGRIRFRVRGSELTDITQICSGQEILYEGYCLGTINLEEEDACHEVFMPGSYPLAIKSEAIQNFLLENRARLPLTNRLIIGLRSDGNGTFSWRDGTPVLYDNFGLNAIPSAGMEQCALINFFNCFAWELYDCSPSDVSTICQADLNECLAPNHGCAQTCVNDDGGFHCTCEEGYRPEGRSDCEDVCMNPFAHRNQTWVSIGSGACFYPAVWTGTSDEAKHECELLHGRLPTLEEVIGLQSVLDETESLLWVEPFNASVDATMVGVSPVCPAANASLAANVSALLPNCYEILNFICIRDVSNTKIQDLFDNGVENIDLEAPFGYIELRSFAPWYYTGRTMYISFAGTTGQEIRLDIISVALRTEDNGCKDSLSIHRPNELNLRVRVICGNLDGFRLIVPQGITLEVEVGELQATMDPIGFSLYYEIVDCSREECVTGCGMSTLAYQDGVLETTPFPSSFAPFSECQVQISGPSDKYIAIEFTDYRINIDDQCLDRLVMKAAKWDGQIDGGCRGFPPLLITNTNEVDVSLMFGLEPDSEGLRANVSFLDKPGCYESSIDRCSSIFYDCGGTSGIIISPDYPLMAMRFTDCRWEITTPEKSYVRMYFTDLSFISDCTQASITINEQHSTVAGLVEIERFCKGMPPVGPLESNLNSVTVVLNNGMDMRRDNGIRMMLEYEAAFFGSPYVDSDEGQPCPPSTSLNQGHWDYFDGACYQFIQYPDTLTWMAAESHCQEINPNGHLVSIRNREEARFIHYMMTTHWPLNETNTYIGLGNRNYRGIFHWTDGLPMTYTDWFIPSFTLTTGSVRPLNEPDGGIIDSCVQIELTSIKSTALWHDIPCLARTTPQFICKVPAKFNNSDIAQTVAVQLEYKSPLDIPECPTAMIACGTGECVHSVYTCDGVSDCADYTDEMYCADVPDDACSSTSYTCTNGDCIPMSFYCDNVTHCEDQSDEHNCAPYDCSSGEFRCDNGRCIPYELTCDLVDHCFDSSDEKYCGPKSDNVFTCYNGDNHPQTVQCDGIVDCIGSSSEDELDSCDYRQMDNTCGKTDEIQCSNGACAMASSNCVYDVSPNFYVTGCRDVSHLRSCENFQCPTYHVKCPYSYCIPLRFRCNDVLDCPNGDDELGCDRFVCPPGTYSCRGSTICLRPGEVCDGIQHCPAADDEQFCDVACPSGCNCTGLAFLCGLPDTEEDSGFIFSPTTKKIAITTAPLILSPNGTNQVFPVSGDTGEDQVTSYTSLWPSDYPFLAELELVDTGIKTIPATAFLTNQDLYYLNLSRNPIETIELGAFANLTKLRVLDIRESSIPSDNAVRAALQQIPYLHTVYADSFAFCCMLDLVPAREMDKTGCFAPIDQFSSCDDLLKDNTLRVFMWILGISALAGNLCTIVLRLFRRKVVTSTRIQSRLITHLAISDLLMGIYMLTIAIADQYYMGDFAIHADMWRESVVCRFAGFLSALSSEVSVFIIMLISIDRILCIVFSQHHHIQLSNKSSMAWLAVVWATALVITLVPVFPLGYFGGRFYGRSSVCLGLPLSADRPSGWEYSLSIFLGLNLLCFFVTAVCYVTIFVTVHRSARSIAKAKDAGRHVKNGTSMQVKLATRMAMIVGTDFICWMPIIIMGFLAASGTVEIPADVYAWTAVFILPLNSSLNPYLYTISTIWQHRKAKQKQKELRESEGTQLSVSAAVAALPERGQVPRVAQEKYTHLTAQCILTPYNAASITSPLVPLAKYIEDRGQSPSVVDSSLIMRDVRKAVSNLKTKSVTNVTVTEDQIAVQLNSSGEIVRAFLVNSDTALLETLSATKHERRENLHHDFMTTFMEKMKGFETVVETPGLNGHRSPQRTNDTVQLIEEKAC